MRHRYNILIALISSLTLYLGCKKESSHSLYVPCSPPTITDVDGNGYNAIQLGTQCWMQQNLRAAHFRDGTPVPEVEDSAAWKMIAETSGQNPAWCYFDENYFYNSSFGKLYNFYAVISPSQICPAGFHIPSDSEWTVLVKYLGDSTTDGGLMKSVSDWEIPNSGANHLSGFDALPAGYRDDSASFSSVNLFSTFWSTTASGNAAWVRVLNFDSTSLSRQRHTKPRGFSVRCVGD